LTKTPDKRHEAALAGLMADALSGQGFLDPKNPNHRKGVDGFFERTFAPMLAQIPEGDQPEALAHFIKSTCIIPSKAGSAMRTALRSGDVKQKAEAYGIAAMDRDDNAEWMKEQFQSDLRHAVIGDTDGLRLEIDERTRATPGP